MVNFEAITAVSRNPLILQFAEFVIGERGEAQYPTLKKLDLLKVPSLVRYIWKIDYDYAGTGDQKITFTGTELDRFWKLNPVKKGTVENLYTGRDYEDVMPNHYRRSLQQGKVAYTRRKAVFNDAEGERKVSIEAIFFPCATDGKTVDSGVGLADYFTKADIDENQYLLL